MRLSFPLWVTTAYRGAVALLLLLGAVAGIDPSVSCAAPHDAAQTYTFAFQDADVSQVAEAILGQAIGVPYTVDPSVTSKLTFRIDQRLTKAQLLKAFEAVLAAEDVVLVRQGDNLFVTSRAKAKGAAAIETNAQQVRGAGFQTVAVPLSYATPSEVAKALNAVSPNTSIVVYVDDTAGLLILGGTGDEIDAALDMVHVFDHSGLEGAKVRWFELKEATAETVADDLNRILKAAGAGNVTVVPLKRLNGLFAFARSPDALDQVATWIGKLDVASKESASSLWIYHPHNLSADDLAETLDEVLLGQAPSERSSANQTRPGSAFSAVQQPGQATAGLYAGGPGQLVQTPNSIQGAAAPPAFVGGGTGGGGLGPIDQEPIRIGVEKATNTLLIETSAPRWLQIERIIDQIDQTPGQVLIEASILEVTLNDQMKFGVDWSVLGDAGRLAITSIPGAGSSVAAQLPGLAATLLTKNVQVAVNTLGTYTKVDVVSAPKVIVLDNHTAKLQVGDQVPVVTQTAENTTAPGTPVINSVNYQSTGVIMDVTPRITGDNRIFLDVSEQVSTAVQTETSGIDSPTIQQREFDSSVVLANGGTVALGGLISSTKTKANSGVPYLKDTPWIGNLFKTKNNSTQRDELIVLITATIINDQPAVDRAWAKLKSDMHDIVADGLLPN